MTTQAALWPSPPAQAPAPVRDWTVIVTRPGWQQYGPFTKAEAAVCAAAQKHQQSVFAARLTPWAPCDGAGENGGA